MPLLAGSRFRRFPLARASHSSGHRRRRRALHSNLPPNLSTMRCTIESPNPWPSSHAFTVVFIVLLLFLKCNQCAGV